MRNKFFAFEILAIVLILGLTLMGCDTGNGNNDPTPSSAEYLNEKDWITSIGPMPTDITSITIVFSGTNQWTETFNGTGTDDGKTIYGTYTLSGLTITLTVTGGTVTDAPANGTSFLSEFNATQATKLTTPQGHIFNRDT
jgi:hypothetical protein